VVLICISFISITILKKARMIKSDNKQCLPPDKYCSKFPAPVNPFPRTTLHDRKYCPFTVGVPWADRMKRDLPKLTKLGSGKADILASDGS
jgi:hypothetical protein